MSETCAKCGAPSELKCSACKLVSYCNKEHQKEDWKNHKTNCRPFKIADDPVIGKCLIATRDIKPGEQILSEYPLVSGPRPHFVEEGPVPCPGCCRLIIGQQAARCKGCDFPVCNPDCPGLQDLNRHGQECLVLGIRATRAVDGLHEFYRQDALLALRCLLLQSRKPQKFARLMEMEAHLDKRAEGTDIYREVEDRVVDYLLSNFIAPLKMLEAKSGMTVVQQSSREILHKICGIIDVNGLEISQNVEVTALYPTAYLLEHSCLPNTVYSFDSDCKITVRAALPVTAGDHVTTMYTHCLWGTQARREHLRETKYFACRCRRCCDPTELGSFLSALRCIGVEQEPCTGTQLPVDPLDEDTEWACDKCDVKLPNAEVVSLVNGIGEEVDNLQYSNPTVKELESLLSRMLTFLHPNHYHAYTVKHSLVQLYGHQQGYTSNQLTDDCLARKAAMCKELLDVNSKIDPGNSRLPVYTGILFHELFLANWTVIKRKWDMGIKTKVKSVLALMVESKHSLEQAIDILKREKDTPPGEKLLKHVRTSFEEFQRFVERNKIELAPQKV
ncbi:unnamed protein product [Phaedon cochleariae]|uniref:Protein msta n=1 Tax=Phaedon cochleariae TaxID=80249 RepID=A0A9P0DGQ0_PHACE|nr:unnamed protein product [Phaedon cochleariae]